MGITVAALGVLGVGVWFMITKDTSIITGFALGASSMALFAGVVGQSAQLLWVRHRSRWAMRQVEARDAALARANQESDFITGGSGSSAQ